MYVRKVDDQTLTFRVSGKLWMRSLVMSDVETGTEWSHLLGRAMSGKLKDKVLEPIVSDMVTWSAWRRDHPRTTVLHMSPTVHHYTRDFYRNPAKFVLGFQAGGKHYALPMNVLVEDPLRTFQVSDQALLATFDKEGAVVRLFDPSVDGRRLDFVRINDQTMRDKETDSLWDLRRGVATEGRLAGKELKQRVGIMSYRVAWQNFHPDSSDIEF